MLLHFIMVGIVVGRQEKLDITQPTVEAAQSVVWTDSNALNAASQTGHLFSYFINLF